MAARSALSRFLRDERGATAVEVGILVALICVALISVMSLMGTRISSTADKVSTAMGS